MDACICGHGYSDHSHGGRCTTTHSGGLPCLCSVFETEDEAMERVERVLAQLPAARSPRRETHNG